MRKRAGYHTSFPSPFVGTDWRTQIQRSCRCLRRTLIFLNIYNSLLCTQSKKGARKSKMEIFQQMRVSGRCQVPFGGAHSLKASQGTKRSKYPKKRCSHRTRSRGRSEREEQDLYRWSTASLGLVWWNDGRWGQEAWESSVFPGLGAVSLRIHGFLDAVPKGTFLGLSFKR